LALQIESCLIQHNAKYGKTKTTSKGNIIHHQENGQTPPETTIMQRLYLCYRMQKTMESQTQERPH
jgi:hypothetical protein